MSDNSPPPKPKPGSLRDRIAAFENKGSAGPTGPPPAPRPKPAGLQWKPKLPSPPSSPGSSADNAQPVERKVAGIGGMSASDAMESIGKGGSLKERMAALQGKGGFGGAPPPIAPKPTEKPKWKPPPVVSPPPEDDEPETSVAREVSRSPPPAVEKRSEESESDVPDVLKDSEDADTSQPDPEEEERQRRAAIAARMARLGGSRVGMGPPIFAPKPSSKKPQSPPPEPKRVDEVTSLKGDESISVNEDATPVQDTAPTASEGEATPQSEYIGVRKDSASSLLSTPSPPVPSRSPAHMPVPAGPRRAAPPRKKAYKSPSPAPESVTMMTDADPVETPEKLPVSEDADREAQLLAGDVQKEVGMVNKSVEESRDVDRTPSPTVVDHVQGPAPGDSTIAKDAIEESLLSERPEEELLADSSLPDHPVAQNEEETLPDSPVQVTEVIEAEAEPEAVQGRDADEEEEEELRRKRVAEKLAQMGAFNPLAGPPPVPRRESSSAVALEAESEHEVEPDVDDEVNVGLEEVGESIPSPPVTGRKFSTSDAERSVSGRKHSVASVAVVDEQRHPQVEDISSHSPGVEEVSVDDIYDHDGVATHEAYTGEEGEEVIEEEPENGVRNRTLYHHDGGDADEGGDDDTNDQNTASNVLGDLEEQSASEDNYEEAVPYQEQDYQDNKGQQSWPFDSPAQGTSLSDRAIETEAEDKHPEPNQDEDEQDDMAPPRITRPIPPPPVNKTSRPNFSPLSPSPLAPPRTPLRALQTDETERAESPDPRPVPPPSSCRNARDIDGDDEGPPPPPPRRSLPPPRRTSSGGKPYGSGEVTLAPPVPASPGPSIRRAMSPETTLVPEESMDDNVNEEESAATLPPTDADTEEKAEDEETARRKTIAERMAKLGGIRFGAPMPPPTARLPPPPQHTGQDQPNASDAEDVPEQTEEEEELARKQRIAAKLAGMGGMRFGMIPPSIPPSRKPLVLTRQEDSENEDALSQPLPVPAPQRAAPPVRPPPPPVASDSEQESRTTDDDGVRVEAEESEIEEVTYEDASGSEEEAPPPLPGREGRRAPVTPRSAEALPTPPPRMTSRSPPLPAGRPPVPSIPTTLLNRRPSIPVPAPKSPPSRKSSVHSVESRQSRGRESLSTDTTFRPQSEYVMVEAPSGAEVGAPPTPPKRPTRGPPPRMVPLPPPPPPSAVEPMSDSNQWELPSFSDAALDLALASDVDLESEEVSSRPVAPPLTKPRSRPSSQLPPMPSPKMAPERQLSSDELTAVWGKVGVQICEAATTLHEKSKKSLVGDGSYVGFVKAVLDQVPNALQPSSPDLEFGYLVYAQTADAVLRRASEIMPGDIIALYDARLKGHKGIQTYHQSVGVGEPLIGVVHEFETKKSKVRVYQANQHVGQQTVESASYRLEDLKSGHVKVFRVLDSEV